MVKGGRNGKEKNGKDMSLSQRTRKGEEDSKIVGLQRAWLT